MKTNYLFLLLSLFFSINVYSQIVNIPDLAFKNALINDNVAIINGGNGGSSRVDTNNDGEIQVSEALAVNELHIDYKSINSLEGLQSFTNLTVLDAFGNNINYVPNLNLPLLNSLSLADNNLSSLNLSGVPSLTELFISYNQITSIDITSLTSLTTMTSVENNIQHIDLSQNISLQLLSLSQNPLTSIDITSNPSLTELELIDTFITQLDISNQSQFESLSLTNIPTLTSLTGTSNKSKLNIGISGTQIPSLTFSNIQSVTGISSIGFENNYNLTEVNFIDCSNIDLSLTANYNITNINGLRTNFNKITTFSNSIENINLENCSLTTYLGHRDEFNLSNINLNSCDFTSLSFNNCNIENLFIKNGTINDGSYYFINNTTIDYICADANETTSLLSDLNYYGINNVNINEYCDFTIGGVPLSINGQVRTDVNSNGCNATDLTLVDMKFNITDNNNQSYFYFVSPSYDYSLYLPYGIYNVLPEPSIHPSLFSPLTSFNANLDSSNTLITQDICITPTGNNIDLSVIMIEDLPARPGFDSDYKIICKNKGLTATTGTLYLNYDDSRLDYISTDLAFLSDSNGTIIWDIPSLEPNEEIIINITFNVNTPMETPAVNGGDILFYGGTISGPTGIQDTNTSNDTFEYPQTVVNSYDPNDIACLEGAILDPANVGEDLHYKIRFENTGTASAINVVVKNTIDTSRLDITSFQPLTSSHPMRTRIIDGNVVEFIFENINLDFNDATNDGYLIYKIQSLPTLQLGDMIGNQAEIYFDFNFPIITNDHMVTIDQTASLNDANSNSVSLFPNPSYGKVTINSSSYIQAIQIFDHLGRIVKSLSVKQENLEMNIDISELNTGLYFIKVKNESGEQSIKLIKE
ncbi:T9SS type A sorting domain-containing protein [Nonlabens ulvanivorans]|uniref:DUF7619 domain-containing protein n=1 Tax=Nonlabens ulvanivorans TaxID=906888 RepID=UPI0037C8A131